MSAGANPSVRQERDRIAHAPAYAGMFVIAMILASGAVLTWLAERRVPVHVGLSRDNSPLKTAPREINMIDQTLFSAHQPSEGSWVDKQRQLSSYTWVDRDKRLVDIPVERAMQMLVERGHVE